MFHPSVTLHMDTAKPFYLGIVGVGSIGGALAAQWACVPNTRIAFCDVHTDNAKGKSLDLCHAAVAMGALHPDTHVVSSANAMHECDAIVVTAGQARTPGMTRQDLAVANATIITQIAQDLKGYSGIVIVVTNPVDTMTQMMQVVSGLPAQRVIGMAGVLDSARLVWALAQALQIPSGELTAMVVGAHNDTMVPVRQSVRWQGQPVDQTVLPRALWDQAVYNTRHSGSSIVALLKTGSAFYGPAGALCRMLACIRGWVTDPALATMPCVHWVPADYHGVNEVQDIRCARELDDMSQGLCVGVPVILGPQGVQNIMPWAMDDDEKNQWRISLQGLARMWQDVGAVTVTTRGSPF